MVVEFTGLFKIGYMACLIDDTEYGPFNGCMHHFGLGQWRYSIFPAANEQCGNGYLVERRAGF